MVNIRFGVSIENGCCTGSRYPGCSPGTCTGSSGFAGCGGDCGATGGGFTLFVLRVAVGLEDVGTWAWAASGSRAINKRTRRGVMARSIV